MIDNTEQEIKSTVLEFEKKILQQKNFFTAREDQLQKQFWDTLKTWECYSERHGDHQVVISNSFLKKNHEWFLG